MKHELQGEMVHIATGGLDFDNSKPVLLFLHGSGQSHLTWVLQSRYFAHRGFAVLAPDLPGHGLSAGTPLASIEEMADWCVALLDSLGVASATFVAHSQGVLITLDAAARYPEHVAGLALIAGAMAILP
jgi:pimeloyl-ACP methyl ester carboxylesterase